MIRFIQKCHDPNVPTKLHIEIRGTGSDTLVFIPGLGGTTRYWAARLGSIEDRYRIVLVDLLGFGQSPKPWTKYSVERHVHELRAALEPYQPATLIGHSLGALLTVAYAARHPEKVSNLVLIGMPYFGSQERAYRYLRHGPVEWGFLYTNVTVTMIACVLTRRVFGKLLPYLIRSVPRAVAEDLVKHTWRSSTSSLWEVIYRYDAAPDLVRLPETTGVLFIHGDQDPMAPISAVRKMVSQSRRWRLKVLPGVDHHPFLRDPRLCLRQIDAFYVEGRQDHEHE